MAAPTNTDLDVAIAHALTFNTTISALSYHHPSGVSIISGLVHLAHLHSRHRPQKPPTLPSLVPSESLASDQSHASLFTLASIRQSSDRIPGRSWPSYSANVKRTRVFPSF